MAAAAINGEKIKKVLPVFEGSTEHKNPNYKVESSDEDFDNAS